MNKNDLFKNINEIESNSLKSNRCLYAKRHYRDSYDLIMELTSFLPNEASFNERLYCVKNNISSRQKCITCNTNYVTFNTTKNKYRDFCNAKCEMKNKSIQNKIEETCLEKYGVKHAQQNKSIRDKTIETCIEKYGQSTPLLNEEVIKKSKNTTKLKYGTTHPSKSNIVKEKRKRTCLEKYGVECSLQNDIVKSKSKRTIKERYGVDNIGSSKEIQDKIHATNNAKYGVDMPFQSKEIYDKSLKTIRQNLFKDIQNNIYATPLFDVNDFNKNNIFKWKCKKCGTVFEDSFNANLKSREGPIVRCPKCNPILAGTSHEEQEICEFIKSFYDKMVITNTKDIIPPLELDIYVPERKLAFEFDGLYWHSSKVKDYHLHKTLECEKQGIQLIHIFENEWDFKQDIVKSRIRNLFGISKKTIYARKCEVKEVSSKESKDFQNENHIQGPCNSSINIGLYYDNEIVSLMTFGKSRFNKKYEYEMLRFCNKIDHHIPGGAGKLLSYFEKIYNPKSLISYADRRWSKGNVYEKLGFRLDHASKPDYWYIDKNKNMHSRVKYQKHKLPDLLKTYDPNKTEVENMSMNGYSRIFDCGNLVYVKTY